MVPWRPETCFSTYGFPLRLRIREKMRSVTPWLPEPTVVRWLNLPVGIHTSQVVRELLVFEPQSIAAPDVHDCRFNHRLIVSKMHSSPFPSFGTKMVRRKTASQRVAAVTLAWNRHWSTRWAIRLRGRRKKGKFSWRRNRIGGKIIGPGCRITDIGRLKRHKIWVATHDITVR
jgi:hypothetical protein